MYRHAQLLCDLYDEYKGIRDIRKHIAWYLKGFSAGSELRTKMALVESLREFQELLDQLDLTPRVWPISHEEELVQRRKCHSLKVGLIHNT